MAKNLKIQWELYYAKTHKQRNPVLDSKTCLYEFIFHPHREEHHIKVFCFLKKSLFNQENGDKVEIIIFLPLQWSSIIMAKIENLNI